MAAPASTVWKLDDGNTFGANCFPARGIARSTHEGAGSWIVAYAHEQQRKFKSVYRPPEQEGKTHAPTVGGEKSTDVAQKAFTNILTEDYLVSHHHVDSPNDLCSVNVSDCDLEFPEENNFAKFTNVAYVNAAENLLTVRPFSTFPNLRELEMPVNGVRNIGIQPGDFPTLQVLDLSYNNLSPNDVLSLGYLPKLKVLTLTGNGLTQMHPDLCQPFTVKDSGNETFTRFQNLEVFMLDDNRLHDMATFAALAALPSLKELNLDKNDITLVPYLKVIGERVLSDTHSVSQPRTASGKRSSRSSSRRKQRGSKEALSSDSPKSVTEASQNPGQDKELSTDKSATVDDKDTAVTTDLSLDASSTTPPFQQLRILSLANNRISEEEHLLAVAAWPALHALILHGNPLVTNSKGEPPLLSHYLTKRLGISIVRFRPRAPVLKPMLRMPGHDRRRISSHVPKVPKQPLDAMLEMLMKPAIGPVPHPPDQPKLPKENVPDEASQPQDPTEKDSDQDNVFLTQVQEEDVDYLPPEVKDDEGDKKQEVEGATKKYTDTLGELLQDAKPDPDVHENLSIQGNVKMLRQILQHPLSVSTVDPAPEKRIRKFKYQDKSLVTIERIQHDVRAHPRPNAKVARHKKMEETLTWMREKPTAAVELPLIDALNQKKDENLRSEADTLLNEIEAKYRVVREESLKASRQARQAFKQTKEELSNLQKHVL